jgi:outer membrane protein OmpA-like peptidoglycan-associated protein
MRRLVLGAFGLALVGCGASAQTTHVKSDTTLGRVVIYRNGVAYFERYADVQGDTLRLAVPSDKVDDFLKSLTVVDAATGAAAPVSFPSPGDRSGTIDMRIALPRTQGARRLKLSYVTEAPSWKPSYRAVVGKDGKVDLQGWAVVDNTSGEDWSQVRLGVGSSSAMSFRFDLSSLRTVERQTLTSNDLFALAPPTGQASYGNERTQQRVVASFGDDTIARSEEAEAAGPIALQADAVQGQVYSKGAMRVPSAGATRGGGRVTANAAARPKSEPKPTDPLASAASALNARPGTIVVEGFADAKDKDKNAASLDRANRVRDRLIKNGVSPSRIVAIGKGEARGHAAGARVVEQQEDAQKKVADATKADGAKKPGHADAAPPPESTDPIGTSHFESATTMTVPRGSSAMVSILHAATEGEVVYLLDGESERGNATFPFKTLRLQNPTDSALESGPVSVFGEGRFIGEGLSEPIPPRSVAFVPFALDRQIVAEHKDSQKDDIARIITVTRGVFSTEVKHTRSRTVTLHNRLDRRAVVYVKHTVPKGYTLGKAPKAFERVGSAHLFRVELEPNAKTDVTIEEHTPVFRSTDIRTDGGLELLRAYVSRGALQEGLKEPVAQIVKLNAEMAKLAQGISTLHEQMGEYRARMDELHVQIVTLRAVKTAGPLMAHLEKKLREMSEKLSKATVDVVGLQEQQMIAKIKLQNAVGELTLEPDGATPKPEAAAKL